jgi:hypothetical protein
MSRVTGERAGLVRFGGTPLFLMNGEVLAT